ncbi:MAG: D-glycerate dehydrogenase [Bacillota bacterium]|nr:D-glycerate dehydrogenase [Bacillota bacterium]
MKPKVIVYKKIPEQVLKSIEESCQVTYIEELNDTTLSSFYEHLTEAEGIIGNTLRIDSDLLNKAPKLKIVSNISVGYDNLDVNELTKRKIMATNTPKILNETTADLIFSLLVATARRLPELDKYVKDGKWDRLIGEDLFGVEIYGKTLGIIGLGGIGTAIAKRAHCGFDMKILYYNRSRNEEAELKYQAVYSTLEELLKESDFVCLMTPLTPETVHLIGEREFKLMKKSAIFINGSRGKTVDEQALIKALQSNTIRAAGLDVFTNEPVEKDNPLLKMNNVVTLPHLGSATGETRFNMAKLAAENLVAGLTGQRPPSIINSEVL